MFGYSAGRSAYPQVYSVNNPGKKASKKGSPQSKSNNDVALTTASLQPAMDGPPSPERIRAYTEQMKRGSMFGNSSRSNTFSSTTSSFRSRDSISPGADTPPLSRKPSTKSTTGNMSSSRSDRPESAIFSSIFSRTARKSRRDAGTSSTIVSPTASTITETPLEEDSAKERYHENGPRERKNSEPSRRHLISTPYNFQHVTHTRQEHLPNLENSSRTELVSEFSAIRASQVPTKGELKGIQALDLHFESFSSGPLESPTMEKIDEQPPAISPKSPHRQRSLLRKQTSPSHLSTKSQDNLRSPPPRPPRSPLSPQCPIELPVRTSSRVASVLYDRFDPLATTTLERPQTSGGFRRPKPYKLPLSPPVLPPQPTWSEQDSYFSEPSMSHAVTTPGDEAWPLPSPGLFGSELADVQEEEEPGSRLSRASYAGSELRTSQSVPSLRKKASDQNVADIAPNNRVSTTLGASIPANYFASTRTVLPPTFHAIRDSWEDDVDFCYENEIEADFDYQWDQDSQNAPSEGLKESSQKPNLAFHLEDNDRSAYQGRCRPSLLVPSALDVPELSPWSNASTASGDIRTPSNFLRPAHNRSQSHASSFKESHGFTLSPSLLIPKDFESQMDPDTMYHDHFGGDHTGNNVSGNIFSQESYNGSISPIEGSTSSAASFHSSAFSRGSARSSSSTRISTANSRASRASQDSIQLLSRAASISKAHRSISSASSLPDLIPSALRNDSESDSDFPVNLVTANSSHETLATAPASEFALTAPLAVSKGHQSNKSLSGEPGLRRGVNHVVPAQPESSDSKTLSPVVESFIEAPMGQAEKQIHGRKTSAPMAPTGALKEFKGRTRAATASAGSGGKTRGSYMLFPQI